MAGQLTKATVSFHTNDKDKDDDTYVVLTLRKQDDTVVASARSTYGAFPKNSNNGPFPLNLAAPFQANDVAGSKLVVHIDPNGNDTWKFDCFVSLTFSEGSPFTNNFLDHWLSQEKKENIYQLA